MSERSRFVSTTLFGQLFSLAILALSRPNVELKNVELKKDIWITLFWVAVIAFSALFVWGLVFRLRAKLSSTGRNVGFATIGFAWGMAAYLVIAFLTSFLIVNLKLPLWFIILSGTLPASFAESNHNFRTARAIAAWVGVVAITLSVNFTRASLGIRKDSFAVLVALPKDAASPNMIAPGQEDLVAFQAEFDHFKTISIGDLAPQETVRVGTASDGHRKQVLLVLKSQITKETQIPEPDNDSVVVVDGSTWNVFPESTPLSSKTMILYPIGDTCVALSLWKSWGHDVTATAACWKKPS